MTKINTYLALGLAGLLLLMGSGVYIGWHLHKSLNPCPPITTNTITIHDTIPHYIPHYVTWFIKGEDTIIHDTIPKNVDTLAILHDYYDKHIYHRAWENDTLKASVTDTISRNNYAGSEFSYRIKIPFTTINNSVDNSIHYNKYLQAGITVPISLKYINTTSIDIQYIYPKGYAGIGWQPYNGIISAKAGVTIFKLK
jgi:hypothetical protein